jgi:hypothetical protein
LIKADTHTPGRNLNSLAEAVVIIDVIVPHSYSIVTLDTTSPNSISRTIPGIWFLPLIFISIPLSLKFIISYVATDVYVKSYFLQNKKAHPLPLTER